jgi:hypothetical protein
MKRASLNTLRVGLMDAEEYQEGQPGANPQHEQSGIEGTSHTTTSFTARRGLAGAGTVA